MSDPAENVEIEDVLASIRRLVSDEPAPVSDERSAEEESSAVTSPMADAISAPTVETFDALVLTQAQRVADLPVDDATSSEVENDAESRPESADDAPDEAAANEASGESPEDTATPAGSGQIPEEEPEGAESDEAPLDADPRFELMQAVSKIVSIDEGIEESMAEAERLAALEENAALQASESEFFDERIAGEGTDADGHDVPVADVELADGELPVEAVAVEQEAGASENLEAADDTPEELEVKRANLEALVEEQGGAWEGEGDDAPQTIELQPEADLDRELQAEREADEAAERAAAETDAETDAEVQADAPEEMHAETLDAAPTEESASEEQSGDVIVDEAFDNVDVQDTEASDVTEAKTIDVQETDDDGLTDEPLTDETLATPSEPDGQIEAIEADKEAFVSSREAGVEDAIEMDSDDEDLADDLALLSATAEDVIDEDMLREMVATIVREELQGSLGERITRNVRKLVRREIHRALASHELD